VASKRFLLSDERLARFRFARMFFTQATEWDFSMVPNEFYETVFGFVRTEG